jgi:hypothetical protein
MTSPPTRQLFIRCHNQEPTSLRFGCGCPMDCLIRFRWGGASNCRRRDRAERPSSFKHQPISRIGFPLATNQSTEAFSPFSSILLHPRGVAGGAGHHRHFGRFAFARPGRQQGQSAGPFLPEQQQATGDGLADVCRRPCPTAAYNLAGAAARTNLNWAAGVLDWELSPDNTNLADLTEAALALMSPKCPPSIAALRTRWSARCKARRAGAAGRGVIP